MGYSDIISHFQVILSGKRGLIALLGLSYLCLLVIVWLFLAVLWVCLQFAIVVFPDHTHLLFLTYVNPILSSKEMCSMLDAL